MKSYHDNAQGMLDPQISGSAKPCGVPQIVVHSHTVLSLGPLALMEETKFLRYRSRQRQTIGTKIRSKMNINLETSLIVIEVNVQSSSSPSHMPQSQPKRGLLFLYAFSIEIYQ